MKLCAVRFDLVVLGISVEPKPRDVRRVLGYDVTRETGRSVNQNRLVLGEDQDVRPALVY